MAATDGWPAEADETAALEDEVDDGLCQLGVVQDLAPGLRVVSGARWRSRSRRRRRPRAGAGGRAPFVTINTALDPPLSPSLIVQSDKEAQWDACERNTVPGG